MKRSLIYIFFVSVLLFAFFSCEDEEVSKKHEYTAEEKAYRDSVEAAKAGVKADFIITQEVKIIYGNWANVEVPLDVTTMCEKLGYADADALKAAIGAFNGDVQLLAVNLVTKADFSDHIIDEAGVQEGFVFSKAGEPGAAWDWPTEASQQLYSMWCVYNVNNLAFTIGMRTGVVESGKTYKVVILWKKGDYRLATIFNVSLAEPEVDPNAYVADTTFTKNVMLVSSSIENNAKVVATIDGAALAGKLGYADAAALSTALGDVEWNTQVNNQVKFFGVNASNGIDYTSNYTAGMGYWYTVDGDICSYSSNDAALYAELDPATFKITVGQKGGRVTDGKTYKLIVMFANTDEYRVALVLNVTIAVDTPPAATFNRIVDHIANSEYATTDIDVTDTVTHTLKKTVTEIGTAISNSELEFYTINADDSRSTSTGEYPGHWFDATGTARGWGDGAFGCINLKIENERIILKVYNFPGVTSGMATIHQVAKLNGVRVDFVITINLK